MFLMLLHGQAIPGGPKPINTLSNTYQSSFASQNQRPKAKNPPRTAESLPLRRVKGDNVPTDEPTIVLDDFETPPAKRRKMPHSPNGDALTPLHSSDGVDPLSLDPDLVPSLRDGSRRTSQSTSRQSQMREIHKYANGRVPEYQRVENLMNSKPGKSQKTQKNRQTNPQRQKATHGELSKARADRTQPNSTPIDISDDEGNKHPSIAQSKLGDTGDEATGHSVSLKNTNGERPRDTGERSRHFIQKSTHGIQLVRRTDGLPVSDEELLETSEPRLNDEFVATNGKRRSNDYLSSPDALHEGKTAVSHEDDKVGELSSKSKTSRQSSPIKSSLMQIASPTLESQSSLPPSNISHSKFTASKPNPVKAKLYSQQLLGEEADPNWSIQLAAVNEGGRMLESRNLGLSYKEDLKSFDIIESGKSLAVNDLSFRIQLSKLLKVLYSPRGAEMRFESAKSEGIDNILDILLLKEGNGSKVIEKMQEVHSFKIKEQTRYAHILVRDFSPPFHSRHTYQS